MKSINVTFEDKEIERLEKAKDKLKMNWRDFIIYLETNQK